MGVHPYNAALLTEESQVPEPDFAASNDLDLEPFGNEPAGVIVRLQMPLWIRSVGIAALFFALLVLLPKTFKKVEMATMRSGLAQASASTLLIPEVISNQRRYDPVAKSEASPPG